MEYIPSKALSQVYPEARGALFGDKKRMGYLTILKSKVCLAFSCKNLVGNT